MGYLDLHSRRLIRIWFLSLIGLTSASKGIALIGPIHNRVKQQLARVRGGADISGGVATAAVIRSPPANSTTVIGAAATTTYQTQEIIVGDPSKNRGPLKVLFLSADTGGGHRASAESLAKQFLLHFPGSEYDLLDIWTKDGIYPYRTLVDSYKHLSAHPRQWRFLYHLSNSRPWEMMMNFHSCVTCERKIRRRIASYEPDVIVSVHPAMQLIPQISTQKISKALGRHLPFYTVVTDLGTGHCTWFSKKMDKMYLASESMRKLARRRGGTPEDRIVMSGLPIRHDFAVQAEYMGDRTSDAGKEYQRSVRNRLALEKDKPMVLVMGGGEGVGSLSDIVNELYTSFTKRGVSATICVVCGRNEELKQDLANRDWDAVLAGTHQKKSRFNVFRKKRSREIQEALDHAAEENGKNGIPMGQVDVVGLGFVNRMAEYMVAADVLVTKAGPGTIAEAAAVGLPIMLTSFLPGQEAGNVDYVLEKGFGDYSEDSVEIAEEVASWLRDSDLLVKLSHHAQDVGHPQAASDIVLDIGSEAHTWKVLNGNLVN